MVVADDGSTPSSASEGRVTRARALIDIGAIEANARRLREALGSGAELCAVVKADGYGHGAVRTAAAALRGGASRLATATAAEATVLLARFDGVKVLVMGPLWDQEADVAIGAGAEVGLWSGKFLPLLRDRARAAGTVTAVHIKLDSGMGRFGCADPAEVLRLARACDEDPHLAVAGFWTHFATASEPELDGDYFGVQLARFRRLVGAAKAEFPEAVVHAANSAAVFRDRGSHFEMARCGIALYGLDPFQRDPRPLGLEPALSLRSHLVGARRFHRGQSAGYGRAWRAPSDTWVGLLPIGYGDGLGRGWSGGAVLLGGRRRQIIGRASMDSVTVDLGPRLDLEPGAEAVLIGRQGGERIGVEEVARRAGTVSYEIVCGLSPRVERVTDEPAQG